MRRFDEFHVEENQRCPLEAEDGWKQVNEAADRGT